MSPELVALYEQRADLPVSVFIDLLSAAREQVDILVYAAVFLHEAYPKLNDLLRGKAAAGCAVRICLGGADDGNATARGREERYGHGIESRCRLADGRTRGGRLMARTEYYDDPDAPEPDSLPGAAVREVREETGLDVEITGLVGTYTDPKHVIAYSDGEVRRQFNVCFRARLVGGTPAVSDESLEERGAPYLG